MKQFHKLIISIYLAKISPKMQETKQTLPQIPQLTCSRLNKATMVCASTKCNKSALICMREDCQCCKVNHKRCLLYNVSSLIDQIACKKQSITPQVQKAIQAMEKIYEDAIETLSIQKELMGAKVQLFGLNEYEIELVKKMQGGLAIQIQGKMIMKVLKNLNLKKQFQATDQSINKYWNKKKHEFDDMLEKLKLVTYRKPKNLESQITEQMEQISCFFKQPILSAQLLYRASSNQFSVQTFHSICDGIPNTLLLFKTQYDYIGGAYTPLAWNTSGNYQRDDQGKTFIFSVTNKLKYKLNLPQYTIYCASGYGPTFGGGHDINISNAADKGRTSYFNVPHSYNLDTTPIVKARGQGQGQDSDFVNEQDSDSEPIKPKQLESVKKDFTPRNFVGSPNDYYSRIVEWEIFKIQF